MNGVFVFGNHRVLAETPVLLRLRPARAPHSLFPLRFQNLYQPAHNFLPLPLSMDPLLPVELQASVQVAQYLVFFLRIFDYLLFLFLQLRLLFKTHIQLPLNLRLPQLNFALQLLVCRICDFELCLKLLDYLLVPFFELIGLRLHLGLSKLHIYSWYSLLHVLGLLILLFK